MSCHGDRVGPTTNNLLQGADTTLHILLGFLVTDLTRKEGMREKNEGAFFVLLP